MKRVVAAMTMGIDMSPLFTEMVMVRRTFNCSIGEKIVIWS